MKLPHKNHKFAWGNLLSFNCGVYNWKFSFCGAAVVLLVRISGFFSYVYFCFQELSTNVDYWFNEVAKFRFYSRIRYLLPIREEAEAPKFYDGSFRKGNSS